MLVSVIVYNLTVGISKKEHTKDYVDAPHRAAFGVTVSRVLGSPLPWASSLLIVLRS